MRAQLHAPASSAFVWLPIWRRILVSGSTTLSKPHGMLLAKIGWQGYHLHQFTIAGQRYGDPANDEFGDLGLKARILVASCRGEGIADDGIATGIRAQRREDAAERSISVQHRRCAGAERAARVAIASGLMLSSIPPQLSATPTSADPTPRTRHRAG